MKKLNKFFAVLVALAMMATLCVMSAFAEDPDPATPQTAKLVKYLQIPEGTSVPDATFTYTFADNMDASSNVTAGELETANPGTQTIVFNDATNTGTQGGTQTGADGSSVYKAVPLKPLGTFTHAGVYAYTVSENATYTIAGDNTGKTIVMNPDESEYIVRYVVKNVNNTAQVTDITVQDKNEDKVNATIEDPTKNDVTTTEDVVEYDGFTFRNVYQKTEGDGTYAKAPLKVSKTVTAAEGVTAPSATFPINIKLTKALGAADTALTAGIYENGTLVAGSEQQVSYGGNGATFNIADGQEVVFLTMPAGTRYEVAETLNSADDYSAFKPSVKVNGVDVGSADYGITLPAQDTGETLLLEENDKDLVAYTNDYNKDIDTPTGILINNLPYIALALVAIGGLVAYVVIRRREEDNA